MPVKGTYLAIAGVGAVFLWSGLRGKSVTAVLRAILSGQNPTTLGATNSITALSGTGNPYAVPLGSSGISGGTATGQQIATDALKYVGHAYIYGGAPGASGTNGWDCSSFVNWVLNHDLMQPIPGFAGGQWPPTTHGPATGSYLSFGTSIPAQQVGAGDLCVWSTHIGIATTNTDMVSALNPQLGTQVTGILDGGPSGESVTYRRVAALCR